jgi:predicted DNA binding protein
VVPDGMRSMARDFDLDLVWTTPTIFADDRLVLSVIGEGADLRKLLKLLERIGDITKVSYQRPVIHDHNLMMVLTDRQKEVIVAAKKHGYYEYPRKVNSEELAEKVGLSKATVVEHLRKAENRFMTHIMSAY